jgi:UDP-N-acetylmuramyl tripeptide synthase
MATASPHRTVRTRLAVVAGRAASRASRAFGRGHGAVIGGRVAMTLDPGVLRRLTAGRPVTVVTGTNGKTTTTRLVGAGLGAERTVATNRGANLPAGLVEAAAQDAAELVFEVDELYVPRVVTETAASVLVLLNLSRDQLDRITEIRRIAERWRELLAGVSHPLTVVANADDPLVVWAVGDHRDVVWVGAGSRWAEDAALCPSCARVRVVAADGAWRCACGTGRPALDWWCDEAGAHGPGGHTVPLALALPGAFNRANAAVALAVCAARGVGLAAAAGAMGGVADVAGRYRTVPLDGRDVRLLMGKNPASWTEIMHLLDGSSSPVVVCLNARGADGMDPSWIWDVPFELLRGRRVVASGDRRLDLSVRLTVARVEHTIADDPVGAARTLPAGPVDLVATYTAFHDVLEVLGVRW